MTTTITDLIALAQQAQREAEQEKQKQLQVGIAKAQQAIAQALGDLWQRELNPYADEGHYTTDRNGALQRFWYQVRPPGLAPFVVMTDRTTQVFLAPSPDDYPYFRTGVRSHLDVAHFLLQQRQAWEKAQAEARKKQLGRLCHTLDYFSREATPEEADRALEQLIELALEGESEWREKREQWQARYEAEMERQRRRAEYEQRLERYKAAYTDYWRQRQEVVRRNREVLAALQAELDRPFRVYRLTYGLVAEDQDGRHVETGSEWVLDEGPDEQDYWRVVNYYSGAIRRVRFYHPISLEETTVRPTDRMCSSHLRVPEAEDELRFPPTMDRGQVELRLQEQLTPLPESPSVPPGLSSWDVERVRQEVRRELGEAAADICGDEMNE